MEVSWCPLLRWSHDPSVCLCACFCYLLCFHIVCLWKRNHVLTCIAYHLRYFKDECFIKDRLYISVVTMHELLYKMWHFLCRFSDVIGNLCLCPDSVGLRMLHSVPLKIRIVFYFPKYFKPTTQIYQLITKPLKTLGLTTERTCYWKPLGFRVGLPVIAFHKT